MYCAGHKVRPGSAVYAATKTAVRIQNHSGRGIGVFDTCSLSVVRNFHVVLA